MFLAKTLYEREVHRNFPTDAQQKVKLRSLTSTHAYIFCKVRLIKISANELYFFLQDMANIIVRKNCFYDRRIGLKVRMLKFSAKSSS